jgi:hypothetical protein
VFIRQIPENNKGGSRRPEDWIRPGLGARRIDSGPLSLLASLAPAARGPGAAPAVAVVVVAAVVMVALVVPVGPAVVVAIVVARVGMVPAVVPVAPAGVTAMAAAGGFAARGAAVAAMARALGLYCRRGGRADGGGGRR